MPLNKHSPDEYYSAIAEARTCVKCGARIVRQPVYVGPGFDVYQIGNHKPDCPYYRPLRDDQMLTSLFKVESQGEER